MARPGAGLAGWRFAVPSLTPIASASGSLVSLGGVPASCPEASSSVSHSGTAPSTDPAQGTVPARRGERDEIRPAGDGLGQARRCRDPERLPA